MSETQDPFETALAALLAPLAQAMVARGVTLGQANEALKRALLQAALETSESRITDSHASLLTGVHRKDIKRLRETDRDESPRQNVNAAALVLSCWATAPEFQGEDGAPRDLARSGSGQRLGFDDLVRHTRADVAPGTMLRALLDQGAVEQLADGCLRLRSHTLIPGTSTKEQVAAYQATLSAHMVAATHNLLSPPGAIRHFDRAVRYSHLSEQSVDALNNLASVKTQALLEEINAEARRLQEADSAQEDASAPASGRFVLGAYILPETGEPDEKDSGTRPEEGTTK